MYDQPLGRTGSRGDGGPWVLGLLAEPRQVRRCSATLAVGLALLAVALPAQARASGGPRFLIVSAPHGATVRSSPGGAAVAHLPAATPLGAATWLWVLGATVNHQWGRVVLPLKPNGRTGWINLHGLRTVHTSTWIRASLHARRIWLMQGSHPLASFSAAIGAVTTPTPIGRFSVTDSLATGDPSGPLGWYAFGLSRRRWPRPPRRPSSPVALTGPRTATSCVPTPPRSATRNRCAQPRRAGSRSACAAYLWRRSKARCASSAMYRAIASDEVAPGEGAFRTCSARSVCENTKSSTSRPARSTA